MNNIFAVVILVLLMVGCKTPTQNNLTVGNIDIGNAVIDAFYSFNRDSLQARLSVARESQPEILYYQRWAECANYKVLDRANYAVVNDSVVVFPITVKDDLMGALDIDFNVTDTFRITIQAGKVTSVKTSSNDLEIYYQAKEWVKQNRRELVEKACEGIWEGGPTPCECVLGMIKGFSEFTEEKKQAAQ